VLVQLALKQLDITLIKAEVINGIILMRFKRSYFNFSLAQAVETPSFSALG
jgi:hypothetical protein